MIAWPRFSSYNSPQFRKLRKQIRNPGPGTPKAWAYPWCVLNSHLRPYLLSLDLGCGSWSNFIEYVSRITGGLAVGMDLEHLQQDVCNVRFVKGDIRRIGFPDEFFDRVFSISVLEHVPVADRKKVFNELFRVLRPGGLAVLTIDNVFHMNDTLLEQLVTSRHLAKIGSNIYGNYDFAKLICDHAHVAEPLETIDWRWVPGSPDFDEERILADKDILVRKSTDIPDVGLFVYTTIGIIFRKHGTAPNYRGSGRRALLRYAIRRGLSKRYL
ncbi:MAG: class I SAM-dependent methyltransferase [Candidatus Hodarchaeota archaeon]